MRRASADGAKSKNPLPVAIIGNAASLIKALKAGRGHMTHDPGAGAVVTMNGVGVGSVRSKPGDGKRDDGEQCFHVPIFLWFRSGTIPFCTSDLAIGIDEIEISADDRFDSRRLSF
ncbi:hypothetical protein QM467_16455 [Rhodoblastus sp. 17X3]|uniref:hypothetical protein n=1 Tax=Rhodoblastus sp. 17X3 TaxID=3047026 RepID=UPI0024B691D9|nr:hypothetical protein [Rhodoblastus sp. 17X3]MDI9849647.1 hypothetical protein [Rhodoblastus sp. 17X3]